MRYILLIFIFCWFYQTTNAQYSIAGNTVGIYTDIMPDTTLIGYTNNGSHNTYSIDINQDGTNDIRITSYLNAFLGGSGYAIVKSITSAVSLNNLVSLYFWKTVCSGVGLLKPFNINDTIGNGNYISSGCMTYLDTYFNNSHIACANYEWADNIDHYIGVRYATNIDTAYGWIRMSVNSVGSDYYAIVVKDFALEKNPVVGIKEYERKNLQLTIYPNPAQRQVQIKASEAEIKEVKIITITGSEVINTKQNVIDVSSLSNGIYFAQIKTDKGIGTKKIVVQR